MNQNDVMGQLKEDARDMVMAVTQIHLAAGRAGAIGARMVSEAAGEDIRMEVLGSMIEGLATRKEALTLKRETAKGAMAAAIDQQILLLTHQETALLVKMGMAPEQAQIASKGSEPELILDVAHPLPLPRATRQRLTTNGTH